MKKILILFLSLFFCNLGFAESYYFKDCALNPNATGNYLIDLENNAIIVILKAKDGTSQQLIDEIELIEKDKIISKKIKSGKSEDSYFIYYLDAVSKSVVKQNYKKEVGIGLIRPDGPQRESFCTDVKADWNKNEEDAKLKKLKEKEKKEKLEKQKQKEKLKKKKEENDKKIAEEKNKHLISIRDKKWISLSKADPGLVQHLKNDFDVKAAEICSTGKSFEILTQKIEVAEIDEYPTFGLEPKVQFAINGIIKCN
jgi:hypothetical protein